MKTFRTGKAEMVKCWSKDKKKVSKIECRNVELTDFKFQ